MICDVMTGEELAILKDPSILKYINKTLGEENFHSNQDQLIKHANYMKSKREGRLRKVSEKDRARYKRKLELEAIRLALKTRSKRIVFVPPAKHLRPASKPSRYICACCGEEKSNSRKKRIISGKYNYNICQLCFPNFTLNYLYEKWTINRQQS